ncbi:MAG: hypothetical protein JWP63_5601 [Candidatus Solibacter sp.]|nr:hypothetical protein [Candidatus Solibacter sp.]
MGAAAVDADPHAEGGARDGYRTTSLYYDTYGFDVFHQRGPFARG